jgi:hypothetical protein
MGEGNINTAKRCVALVAFLLTSMLNPGVGWGQKVGDYRTKKTGTSSWDWTNAKNWQQCKTSGKWVNADSYPGQYTGTVTVTILNNTNVTLNVSPANAIGDLVVMAGGSSTSLDINGNTLNVSGGITLNAPTKSTANTTLDIGAGTVTCASLTSVYTGSKGPNTINISSGILNVEGDLTKGTLTGGSGTINVGGTFKPTTFKEDNSTVNYNASGDQSVGAYTYSNLTISGGGTKTMQGDVTVSGNLSLGNGSISLGSGANNLTLASGASVSGSFDNGHMIVCDGGGSLIKEGNDASDFERVYPVGTGASYTPYEITSLTASVSGTGSVDVRAIASNAPGVNGTDLKKYWTVATSGLSGISANVTMTYDNGEVGEGGNQSNYVPWYYNGTVWSVPATASGAGANPMTVSGATSLQGQWTAREEPRYRTYYSYQSGDWNKASTWTTDPSGTLWVSAGVPTATDRVVILNGRTVKTPENSYTVLSVQINEGGTLDLGSNTTQSFTSIRGQGLLRLSNSAFPTGDWSGFVSAGGGTVEYYNNADFSFEQLTYNNLIINLAASNITALQLGDMVVNGNLTVKRGKLQVNDDTDDADRKFTIMGDVLVSAGGSMGIGTGDAKHRIEIKGDFTNNGTVKFTNLTQPRYTSLPADGTSDVVFSNDKADQSLLCGGTTIFHRIEIAKGTDQTYVLNLDATAPNLFSLYGENDFMGSNPSPDAPSIDNRNALGLLSGTIRLGTNISIPSLSEEKKSSDDKNFFIDEDACLWIDGADVTQTTHANGGTTNSFVVYGKLKITGPASKLNVNNLHGIIMRAKAEIEITDGKLTTPCIRTSTITGTHRGSYSQRGGDVVITGNISGSSDHASLSLTYPDMSFTMSGGTLTVNEAASQGGNGKNTSLVIGVKPENAKVTGGTVKIVAANRDADFTTTAPFWNFTIDGNGSGNTSTISSFSGSGSAAAVDANPLTVLNDFTLQNNAIFIANNQDVTIGGNYAVLAGTSYDPGSNTTTFNGSAGQRFDNSGTIASNGLNSMVVTNKSNLDIFSKNLAVRGTLTISEGCFLNDVGHTIAVGGNITNSGSHTSQALGAILLNGTTNQTIGGDGNGMFGNLNLSNSTGATLAANQSVSGNIRLASGVLDVGSYKLKLGSLSNVYDALTGASTSGFSSAKMIKLAGLQSDGGITKTYSSTAAFLFPIGTPSGYTPGTIQVGAAPATWGDITIRSVSEQQPFATSTKSLKRYWKVTSSGFAGLSEKSVSHTYTYLDGDIVGAGVEKDYIPAAYRPFKWAPINDPSKVLDPSNTVLFSGISNIDGDYTAGEPNAFAVVNVFYSRKDGDWTDYKTWSNEKVGGTVVDGPAAGDPVPGIHIPGPDNPVVIGDGTINHIVTVPVDFNNIITGGLQISSGSTLDLQTTKGHNFGAVPDTKVSGTGMLRISSATSPASFPSGDFGNFLAAGGGTVEYYTTSTLGKAFTLPTTYVSAGTTISISTYNNLVTSPASGRDITLPNSDLLVYGKYKVMGKGVSFINSATTQRTLTVGGALEVGGTLRYTNKGVQSIVANDDIVVNSGGTFDVASTGSASNQLTIQGNITNNGTFDMNTGGSAVCDVTFVGDSNKEITGAGVTTDFNTITVNKGTSRNTVLDVTSTALSLNTSLPQALTLTNGTFRLTSSLTLGLTNSGSFSIPSSGCLSANGGTINIGGVGATNATDLKLDGRLEILAGAINVGTKGTNYSNDIEYSSGGTPEIIVGGSGKLFVNGQIRRVTTINTGSLSYSQSGSSEVAIAGESGNGSRAMLEVLNGGSSFSMSGTSKLVISGSYNNADSPELYLVPEKSTVTGGSVVFGVDGATADKASFNMVSSIPLWDLEVEGVKDSKNLNLRVYPLTLKNSLTIGKQSNFLANCLDVTIAGDLTNNNVDAGSGVNKGGYQAGSLTQTTIFNGASQAIVGDNNLTNIANLTVASTGKLSLKAGTKSNIKVNGNLRLASGILNDGGNTITQVGNVYNQAAHTSVGTGGGLKFEGIQQQVVSGNGSGVFGNVEVNNSLGLTVSDNLQVDGKLTFTAGSVYLDDYLLTLGAGSTVGGMVDDKRMIILNGVISDAGVKKIFTSGSSTFTFPVGVAGKYTPATFSFTSNPNSAGELTVKPISYSHPSAFAPNDDQLKYYWNVVAKGFSSAYEVTHTYGYKTDDVLGDESKYVVGRFLNGDWVSDDATTPKRSVSSSSHTINVAGVDYLDGEYTAGLIQNFKKRPKLYSIVKKGNWFTKGTWSEQPNGPSCGCTPDGNPVVISAGNAVTLDANSASAYSVEINGTLDVGQTVYHNLGHVSGGGTLRLTSTNDGLFVLPGGNFDLFTATTGSTIEFGGDNEATLPLKPGNNYKPFQNVIFSGKGRKLITADDLKVLGNLTIKDASTVLSNELYDKTITVLGNWEDNNTSATGGFVPGKGLVNFNGSTAQTLTVAGGTTTEQFYNLKIDNAAGMTIAGSGKVEIANLLYLTKGNITTSSTNLLSITNTNSNAVVGGSSSSFVNGPLVKKMNAGGSFVFPVGDAAGPRIGNVVLSEVSASGSYTAQYFRQNPYNPGSKLAPVDQVSSVEHWKVIGPSGSTGNVTLRWDEKSGDIIPSAAVSRKKLRVVEWINSSWVNKGNVVTDGGQSNGTVKTSPVTSLAGDHIMTIGVESLPTAIITGGTSSICNDGSSTNIPIALTGTGPWTIKYKINGGNETEVSNIATSPYSLVVSNAIPALAAGGPGDYKFTISYVQDNTGSTGVSDFVTSATITLKPSPTPKISGLQTTPIGSVVNYSTKGSANSTYSWIIAGGTPTSSTTNPVSVTWGSGPSGALTLTETIDGCSVTTPKYVVTITDIPDPLVFGDDEVCNGETVEYSTPLVGTHKYTWSVSGGTVTVGAIPNVINVTWSDAGAKSVTVEEEGSTIVSDTLNVTVNPLPSQLNTVSDPSICAGAAGNIVVGAAAAGIDYQLRLNSDNSGIGDAVSSGLGGDVALPFAAVPLDVVYNVWATNEFGCSVQLTDPGQVTVNSLPSVTIEQVSKPADASPYTACAGGAINVQVKESGYTYTWSVDDSSFTLTDASKKATGVTAPANSTLFPDAAAGTLKTPTVSVTVKDSNGCINAATQALNIYRIPVTGPPYHVGNTIAK